MCQVCQEKETTINEQNLEISKSDEDFLKNIEIIHGCKIDDIVDDYLNQITLNKLIKKYGIKRWTLDKVLRLTNTSGKIKNKICPFCNKKITNDIHFNKCKNIPQNINKNDAFILMIESTYNCNINDIITDYAINGLTEKNITDKYNIKLDTLKKVFTIKKINAKYSNKRICPFCNEKITNSRHYNNCKNKPENVNNDEFYLLMVEKTFNCNTDIIANEYITSLSTNQISEKYNIQINTINKILKIKKIKIRSGEDSRKYTNKQEIENKKKQTYMSHYGVVLDEDKKLFNYFTCVSKLELLIGDVLDKNNIKYISQRFVGGKNYDFLIENTNIIIEVQGIFWHASPKIYKPNDIVKHPNTKGLLAKDVWKKDKEKKIIAEKYGYNVLYLWEDEINSHKKQNTLEKFVLDTIDEFKEIILEEGKIAKQ